MGGLSAVAGWVADSCWGSRIKLFAPGLAGEAARSSPRKLFERCHVLAMFVLWRMGGVDRGCDEGYPFFPAMAGCDMALNHVLPYGMGGLLHGCGRSHPLVSAFRTLGVTRVTGVGFPCLRTMSTSAVAD